MYGGTFHFFMTAAVFTGGVLVGIMLEFMIVRRIIRDKRFHITWRKP